MHDYLIGICWIELKQGTTTCNPKVLCYYCKLHSVVDHAKKHQGYYILNGQHFAAFSLYMLPIQAAKQLMHLQKC